MAKCLVIGAGLLGSAVAHTLAEAEHDVVVFSRSFATSLDLDSAATRPAIRTVAGTIGLNEQLLDLIKWSNSVFYFAGGSTPASAAADPGSSVAHSVVPASTVLSLMAETSTRRIVMASSGGTVYGNPQSHPTPEDHPTEPISIHGHNALTIERYAGFFARQHGLEPVILRIATAYGPEQRTRRGLGVVSAWVDAALARRPVAVYGSIDTRRDFVFARDVASAAVATVEAQPGVYNVGAGRSHSLAELVDLLSRFAGYRLEVEHHPPRGVDVAHTELDTSRLQGEVAWVPETTLETGLQAVWEARSPDAPSSKERDTVVR